MRASPVEIEPTGAQMRRESRRPAPPASARFGALGALAVVAVADPGDLVAATRLLRSELEALDAAVSRFRPDSEVSHLGAARGEPIEVSALCFDAIETACDVARLTGGAVDPTVGEALCRLGYDRDFDQIASTGPALRGEGRPSAGWWTIWLDPARRLVSVPGGLVLDLGSSGKAFAADRVARRIAEATGNGVLVSLGGDVAVAGEAPEGGWHVAIAERSDTPPGACAVAVAVDDGGVASSSTVVRAWERGGRRLHHIVDPLTGEPAPPCWRLASVAAGSCVVANAASTAAIVWGEEACDRLQGMGVAARLVAADGTVTTLGGWPADPAGVTLPGGASLPAGAADRGSAA
ncbi:MAG TPA: FAD:protein FMN transferase [Acidimicrobiales bacterium]|nr:FAD:protein FMN transferase [Acidimicrobiales bacterium]